MHCDFEDCKASAPCGGDHEVGQIIYPPNWRVVTLHTRRRDIHLCPDHRVAGILMFAVEEIGFSVR